MSRISALPLTAALLAFAAPSLRAQGTFSQFTVVMTHPQAVFLVDGTTYTGKATFSWPTMSRHTLQVKDGLQYVGDGRSRITGAVRRAARTFEVRRV